MKIDVVSERENPLLNRKEIRFRVTYVGVTPKAAEVRKEVVSKLKLDEKLTVLNWVKPEYGAQAAEGYVKAYKDAESMKIETKSRIKKNFAAEEKKEAPAAAEEKKEEAKDDQ